MARIAVLDDHPELVEMLARPLLGGGHVVLTEIAPLEFDEILHFGPEVIVAGLSRKPAAAATCGELTPDDIWGYRAIDEMARYPAIALVPMVVVGVGMFEREFPVRLNYDLFLSFPDDMALYAGKVAELSTKVKTRRRISGYVCPNPGCGSRLVYTREPVRDLSCPKCGVGVAVIDRLHVTWCDPHGESHEALLADLHAPAGRRVGASRPV